MLDHDVIQQVKRLQIRTKHQVANVLAGAYLSVFKGSGIEFDEVRPYVPGDDIRSIDWNVTARTGTPHVKRFMEERELTVMLMVDISGSQHFGSRKSSKRQTASELAALLAFSAIANKDKVGLMLFHAEIQLFIPPRKGQKHALRVVREVLAHSKEAPKEDTDLPWLKRWSRFLLKRRKQTGKHTDIAAALEFSRRVLPRKAVLFVISDFVDAGFLQTMRNVNQKHDVVAAMVMDPCEKELPDLGLMELQDAESGRRIVIDSSAKTFRKALAELADARFNSLSKELRATGIDSILFDTTKEVIDPLLAFMRMRERRMRR